jgi:hypothetical protein
MTDLLLLAAILATVSAVVVPWYVRRLASDADNYAMWQDRFFNKFDLLVQDENVTAELLEMAILFGDHLRDRRMLRRLLWLILSGKARAQKAGVLPEGADLNSLPERTAIEFCLLGVAWFHALSYTSVIGGRLLRNVMFPIFRKVAGDDKPPTNKAETADARPFMGVIISLLRNRWSAPAGI